MKRYIKVIKNKEGELEEATDPFLIGFCLFFFWVVPMFSIIYAIEILLQKRKFMIITTEEYYKQKLKELKKEC